MANTQAAFNFFPNVKPLCILSEAKDLDICIYLKRHDEQRHNSQHTDSSEASG